MIELSDQRDLLFLGALSFGHVGQRYDRADGDFGLVEKR